MILSPDKNGLANMICSETSGNASVYLSKFTVSVHWYGASKDHISRLKMLVADYIDRNGLMASYEKVVFYT